jgi:hypothetical protein
MFLLPSTLCVRLVCAEDESGGQLQHYSNSSVRDFLSGAEEEEEESSKEMKREGMEWNVMGGERVTA